MSNEDKKISQLPQATTLQGSERLLYGGAANGSVSAATLKAYAREGLATQEQLDTKLGKEVWDDEHEQFGREGYYMANGAFSSNAQFRTSALIPLNHDYDIAFRSAAGGSALQVAFWGSDGAFISGTFISTNTDVKIKKEDFPENSVFFTVSTTAALLTSSYYSNGPTQESRESAVSDAIINVGKDVVTKLDKSVWDEHNSQYALQDGYWNIRGTITPSPDFARTGLIPINHNYDLVVKGMGSTSSGLLVLFDATGAVLRFELHKIPEDVNYSRVVTIPAAEIPEDAVYFATCTIKSQLGSSYYSNGPTQEAREVAVSEAIQASKLALFVDMWTKCYDCQYDATKEKPFTCNRVELTYEEAIVVYNMPRLTYNNVAGFSALTSVPKTIILMSTTTSGDRMMITNQFRTSSFESLRFSSDTNYAYCEGMAYAFYGCTKLKSILGSIRFLGGFEVNISNAFTGCQALEEVYLHSIRMDISFKDSPHLSLASLQYLVANAANTSAITVTVHPDVYAKLTHTEGVETYLPANLVSLIKKASTNTSENLGAIEIIREDKDTYWNAVLDSTIILNAGDKLTLSMDVEGLAENETYDFKVSLYTTPSSTLTGVISLHNGRCIATFMAPKAVSFNQIMLDDGSRKGLDMSITAPIRISNVKLSQGEYAELPYTEPISSIEDDAIREQTEWANLIYLATAKNISFATT